MKPKLRIAILACVGLVVALFAIQGGEYGTSDLIRQRARKAQTQTAIDSVKRIVDSLAVK